MSQHVAIGRFKAGDWVQVKVWEEIAKTLDAAGTTDGLPFMPEMVEFCGGRYQVRRYAEHSCMEMPAGRYVTRTFDQKDLVMLHGLQCSGLNHDGCQRACSIFWKSCWLEKSTDQSDGATAVQSKPAPVPQTLKIKASPTKYFCQATQLCVISHDHQPQDTISQIKTDLQTGAVGWFAMIPLIVLPYLRKLRNRYLWRPRLRGTLTRTPVQELGLQPGDLVEVKSRQEIEATLDKEGRNRGLVCDAELISNCGKQFRVLGRLDRMISEATGEMRTVTATVMLVGVPCPCSFAVGGCPRTDFSYFREIWLKKVDDNRSGARTSLMSGWDRNSIEAGERTVR